MMLDQYGNAVPADLDILPGYEELIQAERQIVFAADWYEVDGVLLAPLRNTAIAADMAKELFPEDDDGNLIGVGVLHVDDCLKRGNAIDGFYHA